MYNILSGLISGRMASKVRKFDRLFDPRSNTYALSLTLLSAAHSLSIDSSFRIWTRSGVSVSLTGQVSVCVCEGWSPARMYVQVCTNGHCLSHPQQLYHMFDSRYIPKASSFGNQPVGSGCRLVDRYLSVRASTFTAIRVGSCRLSADIQLPRFLLAERARYHLGRDRRYIATPTRTPNHD